RVTVLAFDVDTKPVRGWAGESAFWEQLIQRSGPRLAVGRGGPQFAMRGYGSEEVDETLTGLVNRLEQFEGVPVISFGWVALFILLYILVVGPLDYLFLKKVFKRLELTWVTFPAVVLAISLIAYFTAYAIKGRDLKINKLDLVDLDLRSDLGEDLRPRQAQVYGRSWFTILSPRIQNYTIGVEPVFPRLVDGAAKETPAALVTWLGRPETAGMGASGRRQSQGLFTRTYQYEPGKGKAE